MQFRLPSRVTVVFGETLLAYVWVMVALAGAAFYVWGGRAGEAILLALGAVGLALVSALPTTIAVGADGIVVRWLGLSRFISYASLVSVEPHVVNAPTSMGYSQHKSKGLLLRSADGTSTYLVCDPTTARDLRAAAEHRLTEHRRGIPGQIPNLRRGTRSVAEWARDLRALLVGRYRDPTPTTETLWNLVENPKNELDQRAAAALALRAHLGDEAGPRLRVAIDSCASPRLRVALEAIADADDAETVKQLERLTTQ
jgi:hypothetical protein